MVKRWSMRFLIILAFPIYNVIVFPFAVWFALHDGLFYYMAQFGITPKEFVRGWKSWAKTKEEYPDAD